MFSQRGAGLRHGPDAMPTRAPAGTASGSAAPHSGITRTGVTPMGTPDADAAMRALAGLADAAESGPSLPPTPTALDRRTHQRVEVDLTGRFIAESHEEHGCRAIDMSPGGVALRSDTVPPLGSRVVAYLDHLGRVEGEVVRKIEGGFAMTVKATPRRRDKLAAQLTYLANRSALSLPEDRRHARVNLQETRTVLTLVNGTEIPVDIIDASISGAAVATDQRPEAGTPAFVGAVRGRIVRHIEGGLAIEFAQVQDSDLLEWALIEGRATV